MYNLYPSLQFGCRVLLTLLYQAIVGINLWVAHANRSVFGPDADEFRPERWLKSSEEVSKMDQYFLTVCYTHATSVRCF